jgi:hypothetical protein
MVTVIERASRRDLAQPFCNSITDLRALLRGQDVHSAGTERVAVSLEALEGAEHRANAAYESGDRKVWSLVSQPPLVSTKIRKCGA